MTLRFDRRELAGAVGDLGTLLPLSIGLVLVCGVDASALLILAGAFYVLSGLYFGIPTPVQPMKAIAAYAIAQALSAAEIQAAGLWMGAILLLLALTGAITWVGKLVPRSVVRGIQLSAGALLMARGIGFVLGTSTLQEARGSAEPYLSVQSLGPVPIGIVLGIATAAAVLALIDNRRAPAALVVVVGGGVLGLVLGSHQQLEGFSLGLHLPRPLAGGLPDAGVMVLALTALALPQLPMTLGNATISQADLGREYFGERARRMTLRGLATSMGLANLASALLGGVPMCHGAGGMAAHYRFGARTAGMNLMIGGALLVFGLLAGDHATSLMAVLPFAVMGTLLTFAGAQLALMIRDVRERNDLFVVLVVLAVALATNLAWGFGVGLLLAYAFRSTKMSI
jgi:sulfate permease, SulP family